MKTFSELQKRYRKKSGLSMQRLSVKVKLSNAVIADYELGNNSPSFEKAVLISNELQFDLDKLLKRKYPKSEGAKAGFAASLRNKRRANRYSQEYLAGKLNTARSMISKYESEKHVPNLATAIKLANFFKCSLYDFVE